MRIFSLLVGILLVYETFAVSGLKVKRKEIQSNNEDNTGSENKIGVRQSRASRSSTNGPTVKTTSGILLGTTLQEAHAFYSVPYAAPPIGNLRFQDPQPIEESSEPINAAQSDYIVCYQFPLDCMGGNCYMNVNEDCLVLNVHIPRHVDLSDPDFTPRVNLPVMVWIPGGSFIRGAGTSPLTDGRFLSNVTNTIIVTINYRLGILGFLVHGDGDDAIRGNQGLKDQRMALKWVKDNILKFGGDRDRVTIFGQSAGAQSILFHTVSQESSSLYNRAIMQSCLSIHYQTLEEAKNITKKMLDLLNCTGDERSCLKNAPPDVLVAQQFNIMSSSQDMETELEPFRPIIDGEEFDDQPINLYRDGKRYRDKDIIIGTTAEELDYTQYSFPPGVNFTRASFRALNKVCFGQDKAIKVSDKYESLMVPDDDNYARLFGMQLTHMLFTCPNRAMARFASKSTPATESHVYFFVDAHAPSGPTCESTEREPKKCGLSSHGTDIPFLFRTGPSYGYDFNENDIAVANQFSHYWGGFAKTGNASRGLENSVGSFTHWPIYKEDSSGRWMNLEIQSSKEIIRDGYLEDICDFWDSLNYYVDTSGAGTLSNTLFTRVLSFALILIYFVNLS